MGIHNYHNSYLSELQTNLDYYKCPFLQIFQSPSLDIAYIASQRSCAQTSEAARMAWKVRSSVWFLCGAVQRADLLENVET